MTIINHTYGFIFVHVPKNAGTSVSQYLSQLSTYRDQEIGATELGEARAAIYRQRFRLHKHSTAREIASVVGRDEFARYTTFAVIRDPVERIRSTFAFLKRWKSWVDLKDIGDYPKVFAALDTVDDFVMSPIFEHPGPDRLVMPQVTWFGDEAGDVIVDRLLRFDAIAADLQEVSVAAGWPQERLKQPLAHVNKSRGSNATLAPDALARVRERYRRDVELYEALAR